MSAPAILDQALLDQFDARLRALGAAIVDVWAPGLTDDAIDALVGPLGIDLPEEARAWWRWHNGVKAGAPRRERCIFAERELYSLEAALDGCTEWWGVLPELWAMNKKLLRPVGELPVIWIDGGGPRQEPVAIYTQNDGSQPPRLVLASMGELISIWTQLIDDGALIVAADGSWERAPGVALAPEVAQLQVV